MEHYSLAPRCAVVFEIGSTKMEIARRADHTVVSVQMIQAKLLVSLFMQRNGGEERGCSQRVPIVKEMASVRLVQKSSAWPM
mmetsp:Transcript_3869/g.7504  ORF Transcript_3869/g.7504 Transcript_3869/m.7504 type:complete len:82 (+) Transcript_3869:122-367(+)